MPALDLLAKQRLSYQVGRIRTGYRTTYVKDGETKEAPAKLDTFRFTSAARPAIEAVAAQHGGDVQPWDNRGHKEWEVITKADELLVTLPPDAEVFSMYYEMWTAAGCARRCDSVTDQKSGKPCLCAPQLEQYAEEDRGRERARLAKLKTPRACALYTRVSMVLPDLPDVGVWRLDTKSYFGAQGLLAKVRIMEMARAQGIFLPARLWIDHQVDVVNGQTRKYPVPQVSLLNTVREIASGQLAEGGLAAQLPPAVGEQRRAITSGQPAAPARQQAPAASHAQARPAPAQPAAKLPGNAQQVADLAREARTRARLRPLFAITRDSDWMADLVNTAGPREDEAWEELGGYLTHRWDELPDDQAQGQPRQQAAPAAAQPGSLFDDESWPEEP